MKKETIAERVIPCILHVATSVILITFAAETLRKVNCIHKDLKQIGEKHGLMKFALQKIEERRKKKE